MPAVPSPFGFAYFLGAKLAGYTGYSKLIMGETTPVAEAREKPSALRVGLGRTLIGVVVGLGVGFCFYLLAAKAHIEGVSPYALYGLLIPIRFLEWKILFLWIRRKYGWSFIHENWSILGGILVSFLLDALGIIAVWVIPGGIWSFC